MNQSKKVILFAAILVAVLGTLAHFAYDFSEQNFLVGLVTPVNESTWEHMKLLFFPMLIIGGFVWRKLRNQLPCIGSSLLAGLLNGTILIPALFYTYRGVLGFSVPAIDIATFYTSVIAAFYIVYRGAKTCSQDHRKGILLFLTLLTTIAFFWFTYHPPALGIFAKL